MQNLDGYEIKVDGKKAMLESVNNNLIGLIVDGVLAYEKAINTPTQLDSYIEYLREFDNIKVKEI